MEKHVCLKSNRKLRLLKSQCKFPRSLYNKDKWDLTIRWITKLLRPNSKILDIGFGGSQLSDLFRDMYCMYGIDIDKNLFNNLDKSHYKLGNIEEKIPFKDNLFDCVVMLEVIEHLKKPGVAFKEIKRVLKPGGFLILTTPNAKSILWRIIESIYPYVFKLNIKKMHINLYNINRLKKELKDNFDVIILRKISYGMGFFSVCKKLNKTN